jgi:large conductance mechanosensitive channel
MADTQKARDSETRIVETPSGDVKVTQPKGRRHTGVTVLLDSDDILREQVGGFTNFLREYAVVGLAVGFIVGQQANAVVKQLVASFIDPWLKVLFGQDLSKATATVHHGTTDVPVPWGAFVYTFIEFIFVAVTIYLVVKLFRLDKLKKPKEKK